MMDGSINRSYLFFLIVIMSLTVTSINVRSIGSSTRRAAVMHDLQSFRADIICLQECTIRRYPSEQEWPCREAVWSPAYSSRNEGVGVLIKNRAVKMVSYTTIVPGRCLQVMLQFLGTKIRLFNIYASADNKERVEFLEEILMHLPGKMHTIIAGDFNTIRDLQDRIGQSESRLDKSSALLTDN